VSRAKTEYQAGHVQADILVDSAAALYTLIPVGALAPYNSVEEVLNNFSSRDPTNYIHPAFALPVVMIWNTNLIKDNSTLPNSWYDLANSQWKGKLGFDDPSTLNLAGPLFASLGASTTNSSFKTWLNQVKANNPVLGASAGDVYTDVASGQLSIGLGYLNDVLGAKAGTPVGWKTIGSTFYYSGVPAALTKGAPHPYTARLLLEWFQSYSGAVAFSLTGRTPVFSIVASQYFSAQIPTGTNLVEMGSNSDMYTNGTEWTNFYTGVFGP
jgi:ABC-type Fe3+ transport system substrate-binding protein